MQRSTAAVAVVASALLHVALVLALLALRSSVRHHVEHLIEPTQARALPQLTTFLGPLIGGGFASGPLGTLGTGIWLLLAAAPIPLAYWALQAEAPSEVLLRWGVALSLQIPLVLLLALATALGLWLPFQYL